MTASRLYASRLLDPLAEQLADAAGIAAGMRVIDVLAGWGMLTARLRAATGPTGEVVATADGPDEAARLRDELRAAGVTAEVVIASPAGLLFADGHFDVALSLLRLSARDGGAAVLGELERVSTRSAVVVAGASPPTPEDVLAQAWRDVVGTVPEQLQPAPPPDPPSGWSARAISDVARFDGEAQLWTALLQHLDLADPEPLAAALRHRWRTLLAPYEGADGTLRIPVPVTLLSR